MIRIFLPFLILLLGACNSVWAVDNSKSNSEKCYPESLTEEERTGKTTLPCAPLNFFHVPLQMKQKFTKKDENNIWSDVEIWNPGGAHIFEGKIQLGQSDVLVSMPVGGFCSPSDCPIRIMSSSGKLRTLYQVVDNVPVCASPKYIFITQNLSELMACGQKFKLVPVKK